MKGGIFSSYSRSWSENIFFYRRMLKKLLIVDTENLRLFFLSPSLACRFFLLYLGFFYLSQIFFSSARYLFMVNARGWLRLNKVFDVSQYLLYNLILNSHSAIANRNEPLRSSKGDQKWVEICERLTFHYLMRFEEGKSDVGISEIELVIFHRLHAYSPHMNRLKIILLNLFIFFNTSNHEFQSRTLVGSLST